MIILVPALIVAAGLVAWLFPLEGEAYKHYEGWFGSTCDHYKSWDEMTKAEKEDSASRMFK